MPAQKRRRFTYDYPRPALTVDLVVLTRDARPKVLLIQRKTPPFAGTLSLPGGFVDENEPLEAAARRELEEETGVFVADLEQLYTFGEPSRDPRGWTVSVAYLARVKRRDVKPKAGDDATEVGWFALSRLPPLAFDHADILKRARERIGV